MGCQVVFYYTTWVLVWGEAAWVVWGGELPPPPLLDETMHG